MPCQPNLPTSTIPVCLSVNFAHRPSCKRATFTDYCSAAQPDLFSFQCVSTFGTSICKWCQGTAILVLSLPPVASCNKTNQQIFPSKTKHINGGQCNELLEARGKITCTANPSIVTLVAMPYHCEIVFVVVLNKHKVFKSLRSSEPFTETV